MDITRLAPGEPPPPEADRIAITAMPNGTFGYTVITTGGSGFGVRAMTIHTAITPNEFVSYEDAEANAIAWAEEHNVAHLYIAAPHD